MIDLIVIHCSDTRPDQNYTLEMLKRDHRRRGFGEWPGYHVYIRRSGTIHYCRPVSVMGCHVKGWNRNSIGVCYEGGRRPSLPPLKGGDHSGPKLPSGYHVESPYEDNRTAEQLVAMHEVLQVLRLCWPKARVVGHRDLNHAKACPCFDVIEEVKR